MAIKINDTTVIYDDQVVKVSTNTTLNRPSPAVQGMIRFNTTDNTFEGYNGTAWGPIGGSGGGGTGNLTTYSQIINGTGTIAVNHNLNSSNLIVTVFDSSTGEVIYPDITFTNLNTTTFNFGSPSSTQHRVIIAKVS